MLATIGGTNGDTAGALGEPVETAAPAGAALALAGTAERSDGGFAMNETTLGRLQGGCFCGAVRYEISGPITGSMICHCLSCRRVAAAPVVAWISLVPASLRFVKGQPARFRSSPPVERGFCRDCGTQLTYAHDAESGNIDVATCSLDTPEATPPTHHSWVEHRLPWVQFSDGLPAYGQSSP